MLSTATPVSFEFAHSMIARDDLLYEALQQASGLDLLMLKQKLMEEKKVEQANFAMRWR